MRRIPWYIWTSFASVSCIVVGIYWDISWHMSIGRDTFWTPAHLAIQAGGITSGISGTYAILSTTLRKTGGGIRVWGFRGPLGAFVGVWGSATMVASAPFDNWWHSAYGLDVKILSPPHIVLTTGILGVAVGALLIIAAAINDATEPSTRARLRMVMLLVGGESLVLAMVAILEMTFLSNLHRAESYRAMSTVVPLVLLAVARGTGLASRGTPAGSTAGWRCGSIDSRGTPAGSTAGWRCGSIDSRGTPAGSTAGWRCGSIDSRWGASIVAATYTIFMVVALWLFARVPAEPKLGPVYQHITHLIPLEFPPLILMPAIAIDLIHARLPSLRRYQQALVFGVVFLVVLVAAEWPFASFLTTEASRNWVFGTDYFAYFIRPDWAGPRHELLADPALVVGLGKALVAAILASWLGLVLGDALQRVRR